MGLCVFIIAGSKMAAIHIHTFDCIYAGAAILDPALEIADQTFTPE